MSNLNSLQLNRIDMQWYTFIHISYLHIILFIIKIFYVTALFSTFIDFYITLHCIKVKNADSTHMGVSKGEGGGR